MSIESVLLLLLALVVLIAIGWGAKWVIDSQRGQRSTSVFFLFFADSRLEPSSPMTSCVGTREFRTEQHNLRRVIDPYQQRGQRCGRPERALETLFANVNANQEFSDFEEHSRCDCSYPHVAPFDIGVRKPLEHHGKE